MKIFPETFYRCSLVILLTVALFACSSSSGPSDKEVSDAIYPFVFNYVEPPGSTLLLDIKIIEKGKVIDGKYPYKVHFFKKRRNDSTRAETLLGEETVIFNIAKRPDSMGNKTWTVLYAAPAR